MTLRETVANLMVARHGIRPELAKHQSGRMSKAELRDRFRYYARTAGSSTAAELVSSVANCRDVVDRNPHDGDATGRGDQLDRFCPCQERTKEVARGVGQSPTVLARKTASASDPRVRAL